MLAETPSTDILGLVIYDLPGRDCAAKASNGELKTGELAKYKSSYIDRQSLPFVFLYELVLNIPSHCYCPQSRTKCRRCLDHRARFPTQLGHQRQLDDLLKRQV